MKKVSFVLTLLLACVDHGLCLRTSPERLPGSQCGGRARRSFTQRQWPAKIGQAEARSKLNVFGALVMLLRTRMPAAAFSFGGQGGCFPAGNPISDKLRPMYCKAVAESREVCHAVCAWYGFLRCAAPALCAKSTVEIQYLQSLRKVLEHKGGYLHLSRLGAVSRPKKAFPNRRLKQIVQAHTDMFHLDVESDHGNHIVSLKTPANSEPADFLFDGAVQVKENNKVQTSSKKWILNMYELVLVDTEGALGAVLEHLPFRSPDSQHAVAVDFEGIRKGLHLIQVATSEFRVYIFDCVKLNASRVCSALQPLLESDRCLKLIHDVRRDAYAMKRYGQLDRLVGLLDTQLFAEHKWGEVFMGFNGLLRNLGLEQHPNKEAMKTRMNSEPDEIWSKRPLPEADIEYAALDAILLLDAWPKMQQSAGSDLHMLIEASFRRANGAMTNYGSRAITFDMVNNYRLTSAELLALTRPEDAFSFEPCVAETEAADLIKLLPEDLRSKLEEPLQPLQVPPVSQSIAVANCSLHVQLENLMDIILDVGRPPYCWIKSKRVPLSTEGRRVTSADIDSVIAHVGACGSDRRAVLDGKLHRIAAMMNREGKVYGITMRVGRSVRGNADMMLDILLGSSKSVLVLGEPGSGKTTIIREAARILSERQNVIITDTSNEIAGNGEVPHPCVGEARRMMVPSLDAQSHVMVECVQNHSPHVMVIDEIGRTKEVMAAGTVKQRGVRMIASAHGDLRKLIKNNELNGLVGGVTSVPLSDGMAKEEAKKHNRKFSKIWAQRSSEPTFDVVIQVQRGIHDEWHISTDVASSVDAILQGQGSKMHRRMRDPQTGAIRFQFMRDSH